MCDYADEEINALGNVFPGILIIIIVICLINIINICWNTQEIQRQ
jgi:hypothetical protein